MKYYYYLTDKVTATKILYSGLQPKIQISQITSEVEKYIHLSCRPDVPFWKFITNQPVILKIDGTYLDKSRLCQCYCGLYSEWRYHCDIPKEAISIAHISAKLTTEQMKRLCVWYIKDINCICTLFAEYISYFKTDRSRAISAYNKSQVYIKTIKPVCERLDTASIDATELKTLLKAIRECGTYTLCDYYNHNNTHLWEMLNANDYATDETKWLYNWLKQNLPKSVLNTKTGKWTG